MSPLAPADVQDLVRDYVASEIECQVLPHETSRVACVMPLEYPDGDSIVVWVERWGDRFRVSDYGEAFLAVAARAERDQTDLFSEMDGFLRSFGMAVENGRLITQAGSPGELGEAVWRTTTAAATVAKRAVDFRRPRGQGRAGRRA